MQISSGSKFRLTVFSNSAFTKSTSCCLAAIAKGKSPSPSLFSQHAAKRLRKERTKSYGFGVSESLSRSFAAAVFNGVTFHIPGIFPSYSFYHLVMTNSLPWKITMLLIGKPSISMGHLYHGYVSHNQRVHVHSAFGTLDVACQDLFDVATSSMEDA